MDKFIINGGNSLIGEVNVPCAKNSYLAILAACVLSSGEVCLHNCPNFDDIDKMLKILSSLGCKVRKNNLDLFLDCSQINNHTIPKDLAKQIRSSIFLLGPILARLKKAVVTYPGGCDIGSRPIDLHLKGLKSLKANIIEKFGIIECSADFLVGDAVHLDYPSVGATENIMMAAVLAKGVTKIFNAAKEPEILDLQNFINKMGGRIYGAGTNKITIYGVNKLRPATYTPIGDRIVSGTIMIAVALCGGKVKLSNAMPYQNQDLIQKLVKMGCQVAYKNDIITIENSRPTTALRLVETGCYPDFPTDLQSMMTVLSCVSDGSTLVNERIFENRFLIVPELKKMGADITYISAHKIAITGVSSLKGTVVRALDLRGGASLVLAGMAAQGETIVENVHFIDRGYEDFDHVLASLGADITRI